MASEQPSMPINGNYAPHQAQGYAAPTSPYPTSVSNASNSGAADYVASTMPTGNGASAAAHGNPSISKDEVGWYFVEQYYTTMSKSPEKLHLFYNRKSQFLSGDEAEKVSVCVGQKSISERIKELDYQNTKVRVTNVDSQESGQNIVIQVIGEISNKSAPQRKFTQTFVLAEQTNGYFVLNDILRYTAEDDEEFEGEEIRRPQVDTGYQEPTATVEADSEPAPPHSLTGSADEVQKEHDAQLVDQGLQQAIDEEPTVAQRAADVNGDVSEPSVEASQTADDAPVAVPSVTESEDTGHEDIADAEVTESEKLKEPEPTPAVPSPKPQSAQLATSSAPPKSSTPKTWANLVAGANRVATPVQPQSASTGAVGAPGATSAAAKPIAPAPSTTPPTGPAAQVAANQDSKGTTTPESQASEWQTAGQEHSKRVPRAQQSGQVPDGARSYIKNVGANIQPESLREALAKFGQIVYLDINRQKNCAFVDFATPEMYQSAVAANPHEVSGERIYVEERRIRPQSFSGGYGPGRGGNMGTRGRGQDNRRGFPGRGRGGPLAARGGRGASQQTS